MSNNVVVKRGASFEVCCFSEEADNLYLNVCFNQLNCWLFCTSIFSQNWSNKDQNYSTIELVFVYFILWLVIANTRLHGLHRRFEKFTQRNLLKIVKTKDTAEVQGETTGSVITKLKETKG